jgi:hypothetical protein
MVTGKLHKLSARSRYFYENVVVKKSGRSATDSVNADGCRAADGGTTEASYISGDPQYAGSARRMGGKKDVVTALLWGR